MEYSIRIATQSDIPALKALIPASVRSLCAGHYTDRQLEQALGAVFGVDSQLIADQTFYVAVANELLVGCGGWSKRRTLYGGDEGKTGPDELLDPAVDAAKIRAFFVHPDWARRGIGRRLIELCESAATAAGFTRMDLGATITGEPLYASMGYTITDRFEINLTGGELLQAAHMTKPLDAAIHP